MRPYNAEDVVIKIKLLLIMLAIKANKILYMLFI